MQAKYVAEKNIPQKLFFPACIGFVTGLVTLQDMLCFSIVCFVLILLFQPFPKGSMQEDSWKGMTRGEQIRFCMLERWRNRERERERKQQKKQKRERERDPHNRLLEALLWRHVGSMLPIRHQDVDHSAVPSSPTFIHFIFPQNISQYRVASCT